METLPDLCLLRIFHHLPLESLKPASQVCTRWAHLQAISLKYRTSLTLLLGANSSSLLSSSYLKIPFSGELSNAPANLNCLELSNLNRKFIKWLTKSLPNINQLTLSISDDSSATNLQALISLLSTPWSQKLISLSIHYSPFNSQDSTVQIQTSFHLFSLSKSLNSLSNLRILSLDIRHRLIQNVAHLPAKLELPFLPHLTQFYFFSHDSLGVILQPFQQLSPESIQKLSKFGFGNAYLDETSTLTQLLSLGPTLLSRLAFCQNLQFPISYHSLFSAGFTQHHFSSLRRLSLSLGDLTLAQLSTYLATFSELIYLHLDLVANSILQNSDLGAGLPSIRILSMDACAESYQSLVSDQWVELFRNVEIIRLYPQNLNCGVCPPSSSYGNCPTIAHQWSTDCRRSLVYPWASLPKLKKVINSVNKENLL